MTVICLFQHNFILDVCSCLGWLYCIVRFIGVGVEIMRDPGTEVVNEKTRKSVLQAGRITTILPSFPKSAQGKRLFSFQGQWYSLNDWVEYSVSLDAAFCFYCRCFGTLGKSQKYM